MSKSENRRAHSADARAATLGGIDYAVAVRKGNGSLLAKINRGIQSVTDSGEMARLQSRWIK